MRTDRPVSKTSVPAFVPPRRVCPPGRRSPTVLQRATTLLAIAPILVVFLFTQRALVSGMLAGATKE